jgi:hypothetical protein
MEGWLGHQSGDFGHESNKDLDSCVWLRNKRKNNKWKELGNRREPAQYWEDLKVIVRRKIPQKQAIWVLYVPSKFLEGD